MPTLFLGYGPHKGSSSLAQGVVVHMRLGSPLVEQQTFLHSGMGGPISHACRFEKVADLLQCLILSWEFLLSGIRAVWGHEQDHIVGCSPRCSHGVSTAAGKRHSRRHSLPREREQGSLIYEQLLE